MWLTLALDDFIFTAATKPTQLTSVDRLWESIHETSQWGSLAHTNGGMSRLSLSDQDKDVRDWFVQEAEKLGCQVRIDAVGNIFAIIHGENPDIPPIGVGSHLDTQPAGDFFLLLAMFIHTAHSDVIHRRPV